MPGYGSMAVPLTEATRKTEPDKISWDKARENAFQQIKDALARDPVLKSPEDDKLFILQTDASGIGIGGVLSQEGDDGMDRPVEYYSRRLKPAEQRYSVTEQECLAVVEAIRHFRIYLSGAMFRVVTDHSSLKHLAKMKDESGRLTKWPSHYNPIYLRLCTDLTPSTKMQMAYRDSLGKQTRKAVQLNFQRKVRGGVAEPRPATGLD